VLNVNSDHGLVEVACLPVGWKVSCEMDEGRFETGAAQGHCTWSGICSGASWRGKRILCWGMFAKKAWSHWLL